jgi:hypothetical protein
VSTTLVRSAILYTISGRRALLTTALSHAYTSYEDVTHDDDSAGTSPVEEVEEVLAMRLHPGEEATIDRAGPLREPPIGARRLKRSDCV